MNLSFFSSFLQKPISIECLPKAVDSKPFLLPAEAAQVSLPLSCEVLDNLEMIQSKSENPALMEVLYEPQKPFARCMAESMSSQYTDHIGFLQDTQKIIQDLKKESNHSLTLQEEQDLLITWCDFAENPDFLEKYCFMDWEPLRVWNNNYYFMQSMGFIHGVLPMFNMFLTLVILLIPFLVMAIYGMNWNKDSYMQCIKNLGGENQIFCQVLNFLNTENTFCFQNIFLLFVVIAIYTIQFYFNIIHTWRFFKHLMEAKNHLQRLKLFFIKTDNRMNDFKTVAQNKPTYHLFLLQMQKQQSILQCALGSLQNVILEDQWIHDMMNMGYYLNTLYLFYENVEFQQMVRYSMSLHGYLDNMETVSRKYLEGVLHMAEFEKEEVIGNTWKDFYYPGLIFEKDKEIVKNTVCLDKQVLLTGPNASGKTTLVKSIALNAIFTQQVGAGFYGECHLIKPYRYFHSYMNIPDTSERDSLFEAESRRCKHILTQLESSPKGERHLCILDELFSGTNPTDASQSAVSFLKYICQLPNCQDIDFVLTTHYVDVCKQMVGKDLKDTINNRLVENYQMETVLESEGSLKTTFQLIPGISEIQGAIYVLEKMEFPDKMLETLR